MLNIQSIASDVASAISQKLNAAGSQTHSGEASELQAVIASVLRKMNLVSRDEFDAQSAVLLRTRNRLEALEKQVALLEEQHSAEK